MAAAVLDAHASAYGQVYSFKLTAVEISMSSHGHQGGRVTDVHLRTVTTFRKGHGPGDLWVPQKGQNLSPKLKISRRSHL